MGWKDRSAKQERLAISHKPKPMTLSRFVKFVVSIRSLFQNPIKMIKNDYILFVHILLIYSYYRSLLGIVALVTIKMVLKDISWYAGDTLVVFHLNVRPPL